MSSEDSEVFETAAADVLDLVETVCDMVGEELHLNEEQVEGLIREIRAEKYFEAHGIRTPLPPARAAAPRETPLPSAVMAPDTAAPAAAAPVAATSGPIGVTPMTPAPPPAKRSDAVREVGDFEFIDEDLDLMDTAAGGGVGGEDDDARTEASDMLSDITDPDGTHAEPMAFDDI